MMLIPDHIIWAVTEIDSSYQQGVQSDPFEKTDYIEDVDNLYSEEIEIRNEEDITEQIVDMEIDSDETSKGYQECVFEDKLNYQDVSDVGKVLEPERSASYGNPRKTLDGSIIYDCVWFGNYWQFDTNQSGSVNTKDNKTPIKWRVLSATENDLFLVADKILDEKAYNKSYDIPITWEKSTIRSWLNGYNALENSCGIDYTYENFIDKAFTVAEKAAIKTTYVDNCGEQGKYNTNVGNNTYDKLFFLSYKDVVTKSYGFSESENFDKAKSANGTAFTPGMTDDFAPWWLRSPGYFENYALYCAPIGDDCVDCENGVRPALHISPSSSFLSPAGTVCTNGTKVEIAPIVKDISISYRNPRKQPMPYEDDWLIYDCVWFGNYWQDDTNGSGTADTNDNKIPIKWRVLSVAEDDLFLMTDKILDAKAYDNSDCRVWEKSTIRSWLNGYNASINASGIDYTYENFIDKAFTVTEKAAIKTAYLDNTIGPNNIDGGNNTYDKLFFLSQKDTLTTSYGFSEDGEDWDWARKAMTTEFAKTKGAFSSPKTSYSEESGNWWLRSSDRVWTNNNVVDEYGCSGGSHYDFYDSSVGIRLALHISPSSSLISFAGTVDDNGSVKEIDPMRVEPADPEGPKEADLSKYKATDKDEDYVAAKTLNLKKTFFSDKTGIKKYRVTPDGYATVSKKGILTVKKSGHIKVEALDDKDTVIAYKELDVVLPELTKKSDTINRSGRLDMNQYINSVVQPSAWKVSSKKAVIDATSGILEVKKSGTVKVTALFKKDSGKTRALSFKLKIKIPQFKKGTYTLKLKEGKTVTVKTVMKNVPQDAKVTYSVNDTGIAIVDDKGVINGVSKGMTDLYAEIDGIKYRTNIKVK